MEHWHELFVVLGAFVASSFAVVRLALGQQRAVSDRFMAYLEAETVRQSVAMENLRQAVERLSDGVRENTLLTRQLAEWLQVSTPIGRGTN
ncbi:MAG: hypothetical protein KIT11_09130 [Fimbriimonadaceae bacterium]|nr:hypothetical protein [Fimbriimonadaceae bacterium]QYK55490.1 MAG: hypothetical protein KF733_10800 [Fimbriimonadaceae bacterium]